MYLILYGIGYYGILTIYYFFSNTNHFSDKEIMIKSFIALLLLAFDGAFVTSRESIPAFITISTFEAKYISKVLNQFFPTFIYLGCIFYLHRKYNHHSSSLYGLSLRGFHWQTYFIMLLLMFPLLLWASFQNSFIDQYPFFKYWKYESAYDLNQIQLFCIYEFFYLLNFLNVELLFRGLLVVGMLKCMGNRAVLPMIVTYAFLHFGKPIPETISSALGGYILGIIAYRTENIFGGLFIHIGIALLMDLLAIWQQV